MSRRVSPIHRTTTQIDSTPPMAVRTHEIVTPTSVSVMPIASSSGWMLEPGMWMCSPAGGAIWGCSSGSLTVRCRS